MSKEMSKAEVAVSLVLDRVVRCRDFSWHMWGTETMAVCLEAEAERLGITRADLEKTLAANAKQLDDYHKNTSRSYRTTSAEEKLEERVSELESQLAGAEDYACGQSDSEPIKTDKDTEMLAKILSLANTAELRGVAITADQIHDLVAGQFVHI